MKADIKTNINLAHLHRISQDIIKIIENDQNIRIIIITIKDEAILIAADLKEEVNLIPEIIVWKEVTKFIKISGLDQRRDVHIITIEKLLTISGKSHN